MANANAIYVMNCNVTSLAEGQALIRRNTARANRRFQFAYTLSSFLSREDYSRLVTEIILFDVMKGRADFVVGLRDRPYDRLPIFTVSEREQVSEIRRGIGSERFLVRVADGLSFLDHMRVVSTAMLNGVEVENPWIYQ